MKSVAVALLLALLAAETFAQTIDAPNGELLRLPDGTFVGTSSSGGTDNYGTIFRLSAATEITVLASFTNDIGLSKGAFPRAGLVRDAAGTLWGTTEQGGANSLGTVFKFTPANRKLTTVVEFDGAAHGSLPVGALVRDAAGDFIGTTSAGGAGDFGTIFKVNKTSGALTTLVEFTGASGAFKGSEPRGTLFINGAGVIWGTTSAGGAGDHGTVFKLDGATFTTIAEFTGTLPGVLGATPDAALILSGGKLWGTTASGGSANFGTIFTVDPVTLAFVSVASFAGPNGANPRAPLTPGAAGRLLGTTENGGTDNLGTIFSLDTAAGTIATIASFTGSASPARGAHPIGGLTADTATLFFGTATKGGREDTGLLYSIDTTTGTGAFGGVIDSNPAPGPKPAKIKAPDKSQTTGPAGSTITIGGALPDDPGITEVLVSLNDGPFIAATINAGPPPTWSIPVAPENGTNVIVIKTVNQDGGISTPTTLSFEFTTVQPEIIGTYAGLVLPAGAGPPLNFSGLLTVNVLATGRFTGKLVIGGLKAAVVLKGTFANTGVARFGKKGTPTLVIARKKGQSPLSLELTLDRTLPFTGALAGTISEDSATAATIGAAQGLYSAKKIPLPPFVNVPATLLNPATDKGGYTGVFRALPPTPALPPEKFPQGDGIATLKIAPNGLVKLVAKLADGTSVSTGGALVGADTLPFFAFAYAGRGALTGEIQFRDVPMLTDADGTALLWIRPANAKAKNYRDGWIDGLTVDFEASKYFLPKGGVITPLGNVPSPTARNADLTLEAGGIAPVAGNQLAIGVGGKTLVLGAITGGTALPNLKVTVSGTGGVGGSFIHPVTARSTKLVGIVLQKQKTAAGYFLADPAKGSPATVTQTSGRLEIIGQ